MSQNTLNLEDITLPNLQENLAPTMTENQLNFQAKLVGDTEIALRVKVSVLQALTDLFEDRVSLPELLRQILYLSAGAIPCEAATLFQCHHRVDYIFFRVVMGEFTQDLHNFTIPIGQGLAGKVAQDRNPVRVINIADSQSHLKSIGKTVGFEARTIIAVPLVVFGRTFGVLELLNKTGGAAFTQKDLDLLAQIARYANVFLEAHPDTPRDSGTKVP